MRRTLPILLFLTFIAVAVAHAEPVLYTAVLLGSSENPPNPSRGAGITLVSYDAAEQTLGVQAVFAGLTAPVTAAHIHCCIDPPGTAGVATAVPTFPGFPMGVMSGLYDQTFDLTDPSSFNPMFITASGGTTLAAELALAGGLEQGMAYLNIHTSLSPNGEIRGFLTAVNGTAPIPEPATLFLLGGGIGALGVMRRKAFRSKRP